MTNRDVCKNCKVYDLVNLKDYYRIGSKGVELEFNGEWFPVLDCENCKFDLELTILCGNENA